MTHEMAAGQQANTAPAIGNPKRIPAGPVIITLTQTRPSVYTVTVERATTGALIDALTRTWNNLDDARNMANNAYAYYTNLIDRPTLTPAAKGTQTKISDPQVRIIDHALAHGGHIRRGNGHGQATITTLQALARRGFVTLTGPRYRPTGATVTRTGRIAWIHATGINRTPLILAA